MTTIIDTALENRLIDLYVRDLARDNGPETQADYLTLEGTRGKDPDFVRTRQVLSRWRAEFAKLRDAAPRHQAMKCLNVIRGESSRPNRSVLGRFAVKVFDEGWSVALKDRFQQVADAFTKGYDYFLSFTGRGADEVVAGVLRVNREYAAFITEVLTPDFVATQNRAKDNLLATAIWYMLKEERCLGYFYPVRKGNGAIVTDELRDHAKISLTFVQLLDNEMFVADQDVANNFCYIEYNHAVANKLSLLFLFPYENIKELIPDDERDGGLDAWYRNVVEARKLVLPPAPVTKLDKLEAVKAEVRTLIKQLKELRYTAIESMPEL